MSRITKYFMIVFLFICYTIGCIAFKIEFWAGVWMFGLAFMAGMFIAVEIEKFDDEINNGDKL